ncbi:ABC transporter ATP-binding protein [Desulfovibrio inopinatus]|uniref:ABC transporter ATP-binding protein n=1 Tax=Desulfovibrio inopinatus TaxID=102109 RepID=UPI0004249A97|nr:ABC transporter ATP-binding protein [Desulfovibrio inopinatus]
MALSYSGQDNALVSMKDIEKVYFRGDLQLPVLKGVNLELQRGEFVALQGPSGSGKSTVLHIMGLLDRPTAGQYFLAGHDVSALHDDDASRLRGRMLGFVFQSFYLIPYATALDNVLLPGLYAETDQDILNERARQLLADVGLADHFSSKPSQLSGGQQQRVALARALVNDPELILADEPTGQLDSVTSREIMSILQEINQIGKTIVVVTHDEATAAYASRRIFVRDGQVSEVGPE